MHTPKCDVSFTPTLECLKKNQSTPRPSEHPPVMGEKMSKRFVMAATTSPLQRADFRRYRPLCLCLCSFGRLWCTGTQLHTSCPQSYREKPTCFKNSNFQRPISSWTSRLYLPRLSRKSEFFPAHKMGSPPEIGNTSNSDFPNFRPHSLSQGTQK